MGRLDIRDIAQKHEIISKSFYNQVDFKNIIKSQLEPESNSILPDHEKTLGVISILGAVHNIRSSDEQIFSNIMLILKSLSDYIDFNDILSNMELISSNQLDYHFDPVFLKTKEIFMQLDFDLLYNSNDISELGQILSSCCKEYYGNLRKNELAERLRLFRHSMI